MSTHKSLCLQHRTHRAPICSRSHLIVQIQILSQIKNTLSPTQPQPDATLPLWASSCINRGKQLHKKPVHLAASSCTPAALSPTSAAAAGGHLSRSIHWDIQTPIHAETHSIPCDPETPALLLLFWYLWMHFSPDTSCKWEEEPNNLGKGSNHTTQKAKVKTVRREICLL